MLSAGICFKKHMNKWDERFRAGENLDLEPLPLLIRATENLVPERALDLACGRGRHALWLAAGGWNVTAVDSSRVAIEMLKEAAGELGVAIDARLSDLEKHEFEIAPSTYNLICDCFYLQRDLFPEIRAGVCPGGVTIVIIPMFDDSPAVKSMNPEYLLRPGELIEFFTGWEILDYREGRSGGLQSRKVAEIVARRPFK